MHETSLHIISFDIPYPPSYGGVIDVFYKLKALHEKGVRIRLHCFEYKRARSEELNNYCEKVYYYKRRTGLAGVFSRLPYIVAGRNNRELIKNLLTDNAPILFEGLHSCYYLDDYRLAGRMKIYRESNIEHNYYLHLFRAEKNVFRKIYYLVESRRLRKYQPVLSHADVMLSVSETDTGYLQKTFPGQDVRTLPSFHENNSVAILPGKGDYILYQGNLTVAENRVAAEFLVREIFPASPLPCIIAGKDPPASLLRMAGSSPHIRVISNPTGEEMNSLIRNAQVNVMVTFQPTGLKLKLLNALFIGRFCLVNPEMLSGTHLSELCEIAPDAESMRMKLIQLCGEEISPEKIFDRTKVLEKLHSNKMLSEKLLEIVSLSSNGPEK